MAWAIPRFNHLVDFAGASHVGRVRTSNEDAWRADPGLGLFLVADGMGGHAAGEVASRAAVEEVGRALRTPAALKVFDAFAATPTLDARRAVFAVLESAAEGAHQVIRKMAQENVRQSGMGCTLDAALLIGTKAFLSHIGDGRSYLARPTTTIQLTQDHTVHGSLVARGLLRPSEPPAVRNLLTNAVGKKGDIHVEEVLVDLAEGDRLLLCTDGVFAGLDDESVISELVQGAADDTAIALVNAALARGGKDNATALVVAVGPRRADRAATAGGLSAQDNAFATHSALLSGVPEALVARALRAAVEIELDAGESVPRYFTGDRVGYVVLEGRIDSPNGWTLGPSSVVYPESLAGGGKGELCKAFERTRALRIRADDFREVCASDTRLAAMLYERLAHILARSFI
ncbi:MAG TPA: protein phosphatase 2C domain-containing protein [Polyangiaceae bacterium]|nr:protein phosphatase 2C domain-containing protein [Polyangiaceae bacterium]